MPPRFFGDDSPGWSEPAAPATPRVALVIGNGAYRTNRLDNPARDARLIADALADLGFDTELVIDAGKSVLETAIVRLGERLEKAGSEAIGFFYFAGHGIQHLAVNYLVPVDTQIPDTRYLWTIWWRNWRAPARAPALSCSMPAATAPCATRGAG